MLPLFPPDRKLMSEKKRLSVQNAINFFGLCSDLQKQTEKKRSSQNDKLNLIARSLLSAFMVVITDCFSLVYFKEVYYFWYACED